MQLPGGAAAGYFGGGGGGGNGSGLLERNWRQWLVLRQQQLRFGSAITTAATRRWIGHHRCDVPTRGANGCVASPLNASASVNWTAPTNNGGAAISGYRIDRATGPTFVDWSTINANTGTSATNYTSTGLTNETSYKYRIYAD